MKTEKNYLSYIKYLSEVLAGTAIFVIVVLLTMQCIGRYAFSHTFMFVDDVVVCCFAWLTFAGSAAAYRRKMHYGLELVTAAIPKSVKPYFDVVIQIVITVLFGYMTYLTLVLYSKSGSKILYTTGISYKVIYAAIIYGFGMMTLHSLIFVVNNVRGLFGHKKQEVEK